MTGLHAINSRGISEHYFEKNGEKGLVEIPSQSMNLYEIEIFDQQPDLRVEFMAQENELKFLKTQKISISFRVLNRGRLDITMVKMTGFLEYQYPGFQECIKIIFMTYSL